MVTDALWVSIVSFLALGFVSTFETIGFEKRHKAVERKTTTDTMINKPTFIPGTLMVFLRNV